MKCGTIRRILHSRVATATRATLVICGLLFGDDSAAAVVDGSGRQTNQSDEKRVVRVVRLTPDDLTFHEPHFGTLHAFNQSDSKVLLWGPSGNRCGSIEALTSWKTRAEFEAATQLLPQRPAKWSEHPPIWSEIPGEPDVLYAFDPDSRTVVRIDLATAASTPVLTLPGSESFGKFLLGFSSDKLFVVWAHADAPSSARVWEVDLAARALKR